MSGTPIPTIGTHKGVGIHDFQSAERITDVVKPEIDYVAGESDLAALYDFARDFMRCPEARMFARRKIDAAFDLGQANRGDIDLTKLRAGCPTGGLATLEWVDARRHCSALDASARAPGVCMKVPRRSDADAERLRAAQDACRQRLAVA
jgi:hypothetical protein